MNRISKYRIAGAAAVMFLVAGCGKNFLDTSIDRDHTPETMVTSRGIIWEFINAAYAPMEYGLSTLNGNLFAAATDEAQETVVSTDVMTLTEGTISPTNSPLSERYRYNYEGIRAANFFLDYVADGKGEEMLALNRDIVSDRTNYEKDLLYLGYARAEARVLKAYYYGELIKMYGGVPMIETTYAENPSRLYERADYDVVVDDIVTVIDDNIDLLAPNWNEDTGRKGRLTKDVALAIKARVLLYAASPRDNATGGVAKWEAAAAAADEIIALGTYSLDSDYGEYFKGARTLTSAETIYAVRKDLSMVPETLNYPIGSNNGGESGVTPTHSLVSAYEQLSNTAETPGDPYYGKDPRLGASVVIQGSTWNGRTIDMTEGGADDPANRNTSRTGYYLKKFLQPNLDLRQGATAQHNWPVFRYAEILLNFAEAANEAAGPDAAGYTMTPRAALQMVRDRASAFLPAIPAGVTQDEFRDMVKHERRIELAFEGHRYWDLLRWKDAGTVLAQPVTGVKAIRLGSGEAGYPGFRLEVQEVAQRRFDPSKNYYMPFPRTEVVNSNGLIEQNEGYE